MDRAERIGLGVAVVGHVVLFGLLSVGFLATPNPVDLKPVPIDVSLVSEVGLEAQAPASVEPPATSIAPETGPPEDAAPPAPEAAPEPAPEPDPQPAPPQPAPEPKPAPKPAPKAPAKKAAPKAEPKAQPKAEPKAAPKAPAKTAPKAEAKAKAEPKKAAAKGSGSDSASKSSRPRGSRLGDDFRKGLTDSITESRSPNPPSAAKIDARALAGIESAIARQIQPCADRQSTTGMPGANSIVTKLNLRLNRNGSLSANPKLVSQTGVTSENERYAQRVADIGIAALKACSPLKLPPELYQTANGGWSNFNYNWRIR